MRTGIWTTVGAALLIASVALSAAWAGPRSASIVALEAEFETLAGTLEDATDRPSRKLRGRLARALKQLKKSDGDLFRDVGLLRKAGQVMAASHDSPEEVQMQLLIFGVVARTVEDVEAVHADAEQEFEGLRHLLSTRQQKRFQKRLDRADVLTQNARALCNNEVIDANFGRKKFGDIRDAIRGASKEIDRASPLLGKVKRALAKIGEPANVPTLPALTGNESASVLANLAAGQVDPTARQLTHGQLTGSGADRAIELGFVGEGGDAWFLRVPLGAAGDGQSHPFTDQFDGAALGALQAIAIRTSTLPHHDGLVVRLRVARTAHLGIISLEQESVSSSRATSTLTLPSSFPKLPPTEITFSLLLPAVQ